MKKIFCILLAGVYLLTARAQILDSIKTPTGPLYYTNYGKGKPILLLSGGPGLPAFMLEPIATVLSKEFQPILLEQRGTGRSIPNPFDSTTINLQQAANDITLLKNQLAVKKLTIIGHSYGAALALYYTVLYPEYVEKLILVPAPALQLGTSFGNENRISRSSVAEREALKKINDSIRLNIATPATLERNTKIYLRTAIYDAYQTDSLYTVLSKGGPLNVKMNQLMQRDLLKTYNLRDEVGKVEVPTLVICGRQDPSGVFPTFELAQKNKKILIHWINKAGHYPFAEQPEEFYNALLPFLKQ